LQHHCVTPNLQMRLQTCTVHSSGRGEGGFNPQRYELAKITQLVLVTTNFDCINDLTHVLNVRLP
jgi:hypothetical protein